MNVKAHGGGNAAISEMIADDGNQGRARPDSVFDAEGPTYHTYNSNRNSVSVGDDGALPAQGDPETK